MSEQDKTFAVIWKQIAVCFIPVVIFLLVNAVSASATTGHTPVTICHKGQTITVDDDAVPAHKAHGDTIGECSKPCTKPPTEPPVTPPPATPTTPPSSPSTVPPSAPPASTPPPTSVPPSNTQPPCKVCSSRRTFTIRLARPSGKNVKSAVVYFNNKKVPLHKRASDGRWVAVISFYGNKYFPNQREVIGISVKYKDGSQTGGIRRYRPCNPVLDHLNEPWRV